jgi:hypothetical protein
MSLLESAIATPSDSTVKRTFAMLSLARLM